MVPGKIKINYVIKRSKNGGTLFLSFSFTVYDIPLSLLTFLSIFLFLCKTSLTAGRVVSLVNGSNLCETPDKIKFSKL